MLKSWIKKAEVMSSEGNGVGMKGWLSLALEAQQINVAVRDSGWWI